MYQHFIENILALSDQFDKVHPAAVLLVLTLALVYSVVKKAFWNWYNSGGRLRSENETAKERKKTQRQLTVMVTSLFAWPMTGAENYGHNSCHLLPSSFSLRSIEIHIRLNEISLDLIDIRSLKKIQVLLKKTCMIFPNFAIRNMEN